MPTKQPSGALSQLDHAHQKRMEGKRDEALRIGVAILSTAPQQVAAALVVAQTLIDADQMFVAAEAASRLVDAFIRRGSLAEAVVAAALVKRAGENADPLYQGIAAAFAKGSKRIGDVPPAPPPLPPSTPPPANVQSLSGDVLLARAEQALSSFMSTADSMPIDSKLPAMPLFSALDAKSLDRLLRTLTVRDVKIGEDAMKQGDEGKEAFIVTRGALSVTRTDEQGNKTLLAVLGPGSIVGEMALVTDSPRAATVTADEPSVLLVADRESLEKIASEAPAVSQELGEFCRGRMITNLLRHSAILGAVDPSKRESLMARFTTRSFAPGQVIVEEGKDSDGIFLIASGAVQVTKSDKDGDSVLIAALGPGEVVGEISLVLRRPAMATVTAEHPTVAFTLKREHFQDVIREHPTLLTELYELATKRDTETKNVFSQEATDAEDFVIV